ncbi:MAG: hypothetical protein J6Z49_12595 [Kiritimatiellae bacterium]|nr:hypothetical protein [Kiritimatiellia bacterium]
MAKRDIIALVKEDDAVRGAVFAPRTRGAYTRTAGGEWLLERADPAQDEEPQSLADAAALTVEKEAEASEEGGEVAADDTPEVRALTLARKDLAAKTVVLGIPLDGLVARVFKLPVEAREDLASVVALQIGKLTPYAEDELTVSYEVLGETETELWTLAAAWPVALSDKIAAEMELAKLCVTRVDIAVLGWFRSLCGPYKWAEPGCRAVLLDAGQAWDLLVIRDGILVFVRHLGEFPAAATAREVMLSLLDVEQQAGSLSLDEVQILAREPAAESVAELSACVGRLIPAPVHVSPLPDPDGGVNGVALRASESAQLDLTPELWRDELKASILRRRILWGCGIAAAVWVVLMGVLAGGPVVYEKVLTPHVRELSKRHAKTYKKVSDTRERVNLILSYTDRTKSALEQLKFISEKLPDGITLTAITYRKTDGVKVSGEADQPELVYEFKNAMTANPAFQQVMMTGPSQSKGRHKFEINAVFKGVEEKKK